MNAKLFLAASAALSLAACGDTADEADTNADRTVADSQDGLQTSLDPATPTTAQEFATIQSSSDAYEIEAGRMAEQNATGQAVKDFGAMMVRDHTAATDNLKTVLQQIEGSFASPEMTAEQQSNLAALRDAGANFDRVYMEQQVAAHEEALAMLRDYAQNGDTASLQEFASRTAEVVEGHLEQARKLYGETR